MRKDNDYEKKTYKSFILIFIIMIASIPFFICMGNYFNLSEFTPLKLIFLTMDICMILIAFIIYKKERVYWITTYDYYTAEAMTSTERKRIGGNLFKSFGICFGVSSIYFLISLIVGASVLADSIMFIVWVLVACIKA